MLHITDARVLFKMACKCVVHPLQFPLVPYESWIIIKKCNSVTSIRLLFAERIQIVYLAGWNENVFYSSDAWEFLSCSTFYTQMDWLSPHASEVQDLWTWMWRWNFHLVERQTEACLCVEGLSVCGDITGGHGQTHVWKHSCIARIIPQLSLLWKTANH